MAQGIWSQLAMNLERALIAALVAALLGIIYAAIVHWAYERTHDTPYTALFVVFGVTLTLAAAFVVVPAQWVIIVAVLFGITGLPQIIMSMVREETRRHRERDEARRHIEETLS